MGQIDPAARVRNHLVEALAEGPVSFDDLLARLEADGIGLGPEPEERLFDVLETMDRIRYISDPPADGEPGAEPVLFDELALLVGATWTVPITDLDIATDSVAMQDLGLLTGVLYDDWCTLDGGGSADRSARARRVAAAAELGVEGSAGVGLPPGWLAAHGFVTSGVAEFFFDEGELNIRRVEVAPSPDTAIVEAFIEQVMPDTGNPTRHLLDQVMIDMLLVRPDLRFATWPLLDDLVTAAGCERRSSWVAPVGFDHVTQARREHVDDVAYEQAFNPAQANAYATVMRAWDAWQATPGELDDAAAVARALDDLAVGMAFAQNNILDEPTDELVDFAESLRHFVPERLSTGPTWLTAEALCAGGRTVEFEAVIEELRSLDPDHPSGIYDQAWFANDRGDAQRAKDLLQRLGPEISRHDVAILDEILDHRYEGIGRNQPCPCGSGRKFKHCHLGVTEVALADRLTWLYRKANWWLARRHGYEVESLAWLRARNSAIPPDELIEHDPLIVDAVFTENGRFAEWLAERGALLPSDEAMLAEQWALIGRSVFEVTEIRLDAGVTVRDLRTGDVLDVDERRGTRDLDVGSYVLTRPLPTGDGRLQFFGGITRVPDVMRDRLIEVLDAGPTAAELLSLVADAEAPPTLHNTDGEPLMQCTSTWHVPDPNAAEIVLDAMFERETQPGSWTWLRTDDDSDSNGDQGQTVLGNVVLDHDRLVIETNSERRSDLVVGMIAQELGGAVLREELRIDFDEVLADRAYEREVLGDTDRADQSWSPLSDQVTMHEEVREALRAHVERAERAWVDDSISALGGITPRQALDDPTRRDDLFRLLDRMEAMEATEQRNDESLGMRVHRLRALLGIEG